MLELNFINKTGYEIEEKVFQELNKKFYDNLENRVNKMLEGRDGIVNLMLVEDDEIWIINRDYRSKDKPTDVISFAYFEGGDLIEMEEQFEAGDIFISVDTAKRQAKEKGHDLKQELRILFVHGLLHVFGYDHQNDEEEEEMEAEAKKILL